MASTISSETANIYMDWNIHTHTRCKQCGGNGFFWVALREPHPVNPSKPFPELIIQREQVPCDRCEEGRRFRDRYGDGGKYRQMLLVERGYEYMYADPISGAYSAVPGPQRFNGPNRKKLLLLEKK